MGYSEVRINNQNFESMYLQTFLLQIILSEILDVPTSVETGSVDSNMNFYHPYRSYDRGAGRNDQESLKVAKEFDGDCGLARQQRTNDKNDTTYIPCAHIVPEMWNINAAFQLERGDIIEPPKGVGVLYQEGWFVPKFTAQRKPHLLSYIGLQNNREELADTFKRPTTWSEYCTKVSTTNCTVPDNVASRPPSSDVEGQRYFYSDDTGHGSSGRNVSIPVYTGFFRSTEENDCVSHPNTCTGHITDYPCGWTSSVLQQSYHLNISVRSSGPEGEIARGYSYESMGEIWRAANWTKSDVLMYMWTPGSGVVHAFAGTSAEFTRVALPQPTSGCFNERVVNKRCEVSSIEDAVGGPLGSCDDGPTQPILALSQVLREQTEDPSIDEALKSPAYRKGLFQKDIQNRSQRSTSGHHRLLPCSSLPFHSEPRQ